jgi:hypothetical protein
LGRFGESACRREQNNLQTFHFSLIEQALLE